MVGLPVSGVCELGLEALDLEAAERFADPAGNGVGLWTWDGAEHLAGLPGSH